MIVSHQATDMILGTGCSTPGIRVGNCTGIASCQTSDSTAACYITCGVRFGNGTPIFSHQAASRLFPDHSTDSVGTGNLRILLIAADQATDIIICTCYSNGGIGVGDRALSILSHQSADISCTCYSPRGI